MSNFFETKKCHNLCCIKLSNNVGVKTIKDDNQYLIHGDIHFENIIWHPTQPKIIALLDWEMCGLGNFCYDLAYFLKDYHWKYRKIN